MPLWGGEEKGRVIVGEREREEESQIQKTRDPPPHFFAGAQCHDCSHAPFYDLMVLSFHFPLKQPYFPPDLERLTRATPSRGTTCRLTTCSSQGEKKMVHTRDFDNHILLLKNVRVFLCKSGLFLEKLNEKMGGDGVTKERFGPEDFQVSLVSITSAVGSNLVKTTYTF